MLRSRPIIAGVSTGSSTASRRSDIISRNRKLLKRKRPSRLNGTFSGYRLPPTTITVLIVIVLMGVTILEFVYLASLDEFNEDSLWKPLRPSFLRSTLQLSMGDRLGATASGLPPLDDYFRRPHIRYNVNNNVVPLVVGGSDGSGTRAFVQALQDLGVDMVVEDAGTMDVHGTQLFGGEGWPGLVGRVFQATHAAVYQIETLPDTLHTVASTDLRHLLSNMKVAAGVLRQVKENAAAGEGAETAATSGISFGFKAPVTMLLLPFFRQELPAFKFLHIVRDGRDVAFSDNHSPVEKFYDIYYQDAADRDRAMLDHDVGYHARDAIKAMQLWNDWNQQVYDYEMKETDGEALDVLVMRSEDLLHHKYEALMQLADFVGSSLSPQQICCLSHKAAKDIGKVVKSFGDNIDDPPPFGGASDFDTSGGRYHGMLSNAAGRGLQGNAVQDGADTGSWADIRQKMLDQHRNEDANDKERRRLSESPLRPGEAWRESRPDMMQAISRFSNRLSGNGDQKPDQVENRYGKWRDKLAHNPDLKERLFAEGRGALRAFGYEPPRTFMDTRNDDAPVCDKTIVCSQG